jgi:ATP-binding cassette subfamily B protein
MHLKKPFENNVLKFIIHYLKQHKLAQIGFFVVAVCWAIELTLSPYLLKRIIDVTVQFSGKEMVAHIVLPCVLYGLMSIFMNINFRLYDYINLRIYPAIKSKIGQDMFDYLVPHAYTFFQNNFAGTLTKKIFDMVANVERLCQIFNEWFYPRIFALLIASISMGLVVKPLFGVVLLLWSVIYIIFSYGGAKWTERYAHELSQARATMSGTISDSISNVMLTKIFSNAESESQRVGKSLDHLVSLDRKVSWIQLILNMLQGIMVLFLTTIMLFLLVRFRLLGDISVGDFSFVLMLSMFISVNLWQIGTQMLEFSKSVGECRQALSYLIEPHAVSNKTDAKPIIISRGKIEFKHVNFNYENNQSLFEDLNVTIYPGQHVGLVGPSGGGKSTFIKLILRLMDIDQGSICIDDQDIKDVLQESLRKQIACIAQETDLFHRSIVDNIRFAQTEATWDEVIAASKHAHCHEFITALPNGYESLVGERGVKLSGGQKQRIAIARAFLKDSPIVLLDEATSALDSVTEKQIQESLKDMMKDKTTIAIAHRLSTLKNMDRILVFDQGRITQDGTLEELIADKQGLFYSLWTMQSSGFLTY